LHRVVCQAIRVVRQSYLAVELAGQHVTRQGISGQWSILSLFGFQDTHHATSSTLIDIAFVVLFSVNVFDTV